MKSNQQDEIQIRELCDKVAKGIRARNLEQVMAAYADDVVQFDVRSPLAQHGADEVRETTREWFDRWEGEIDFEVRDLTIATGGDIAFAHSFNRSAGTTKNGERVEMWVRWTAGCRRRNGAWLVTHEHVSMPLDPRTMKADFAAKP